MDKYNGWTLMDLINEYQHLYGQLFSVMEKHDYHVAMLSPLSPLEFEQVKLEKTKLELSIQHIEDWMEGQVINYESSN